MRLCDVRLVNVPVDMVVHAVGPVAIVDVVTIAKCFVAWLCVDQSGYKKPPRRKEGMMGKNTRGIVLVVILLVGCGTEQARWRSQKVTIPVRVVGIQAEDGLIGGGGGWDLVTVECPTGTKLQLHSTRGMYKVGDTLIITRPRGIAFDRGFLETSEWKKAVEAKEDK